MSVETCVSWQHKPTLVIIPFGIMLNQFYYDAEAEVPKFMYTGLYLSVYTNNLVLDRCRCYYRCARNVALQRLVLPRACDYFLLANLWGTPP